MSRWLDNLPLPVRTWAQIEALAAALLDRERSGRFHAGGEDYSLDEMRQLYELLGRPTAEIPLVHVAGSKGKGSVCLLLESLLAEQGIRVGTTVSPHVESWGERIRVGGEPLSQAAMGRLLEQALRAGAVGLRRSPSFFETFIAAALLAFEESRVEVAIVEVGIGGLRDATNVVDADVAVITSIEKEHVAVLGQELCDIALQKAGILKPGAHAISGVEAEPAAAVIRDRARELGLNLWEWGRGLEASPLDTGFRLTMPDRGPLELPQPAGGPHAIQNGALAVAALVALGRRVPDLSLSTDPLVLAAGLRRAYLPGRAERVGQDPPVIRDGAHTPRSLGDLGRWFARQYPGGPRVVVLGLQRDKAVEECLQALKPFVGPLIATTVPGGRSRSPEELVESARAMGFPAECRPELKEALGRARQLAGTTGAVLVTGSFWLAGEVRALDDGTA